MPLNSVSTCNLLITCVALLLLAPTLAKAQARGELNGMELHTLVLLYRTSVLPALSASNNEVQRFEIFVKMEQYLGNRVFCVRTCCTASLLSEQGQEAIEARELELLVFRL